MPQDDTIPVDSGYREVVLKTAGMVRNGTATALARELGLDVIDLTWEDTGRFKDSAVGPNISDMTIQVEAPLPNDPDSSSIHCMPIIRFPNFADKTADIDPAKFFLTVGNEKGQPLRRITLREFLENPTLYLSNPGSWKGQDRRSLLAKRDSKVLVSAQACFLPIAKSGKATFNPVLFNYQSVKEDPAVLTILVTPEGTSTTIIDNTRDAFEEGSSWGQRLFFNQNGQRASLTGQRISDVREKNGESATDVTPEAAGEKGLNLVMLIQVPLKQRSPQSSFGGFPGGVVAFSVAENAVLDEGGSDVENAVIGHGDVENSRSGLRSSFTRRPLTGS
jgi:hypothetical protein